MYSVSATGVLTVGRDGARQLIGRRLYTIYNPLDD